MKILLFLLMIMNVIEARPPPTHPGQLLYLMRSKKTDRAIQAYRAYAEHQGGDQFELLHEMAWALIEEGVRSDESDILLLSLFGASLANDERALPILIRTLTHPDPQVQLACIHFLAKMHHDVADKEIAVGMSSNQLLIRLETLLLMAEKKMPNFCTQGEALMSKLPKETYFLFPPLFALAGDASSLKQLRRFLSDPDDKVRAASIISVEQTKREEFLPVVRRLCKHSHPLVQETAASCVGALKDDHGRECVEKLSHSTIPEVRVTALKSLWSLGDRTVGEKIFDEAKKGNLYALPLLGEMPCYQDFLVKNTHHKEPIVRLNAAKALLDQKDPRCVKTLLSFLVENCDNWSLVKHSSPGKSLHYLTWEPQNEDNVSIEVGLRAKEALLTQMLDLPEKDFLSACETLLDHNVKPLLPTLVDLLEKCHSEDAINLLKKYQQKVGAPLVRQLCTLGLYRLGIPGPYKEEIRTFLKDWNGSELIQFRPLIAQASDPLDAHYELTPQEISRMLVESFEALVQMQDHDVISILLDAIEHGHANNKYALAGVLIRATQ